MPQSTRPLPKVAQVEDCESDESSVKPGTARMAKRGTHSSRPAKVVQRRGGSDSGYSSHTNTTNGSAPAQTMVATTTTARQPAAASPTKSRPILHTSDSQRARPKAPSQSASVSKQCTDPKCPDPNCASKRNPERRYTLQQPVDPTQYAAAMAHYQQQAQQNQQAPPSARQYQYPQYAQPPLATPIAQAAPVLPLARPRTASTSGTTRPISIHGYSNVSYTSQPQQHGPPPSPSAYRNYFPAQYQQYPQPVMYGSTPPNQIMSAYPPQSPIMPSPTSMPYVAAPGLARTYSTREVTNAVGSYEAPKPAMQRPISRTISARHATNMPGTFPDPQSDEAESESASESETDSEDEREREREEREKQRRARARDSKIMPPPSRRPSLSQRNTAPAVPPRLSREPLRRNPRSDTDVDYPSSSDYVDSDRTARAVIDRPRTDSSYSGRSRRPSVSTTTTSSGRTKATTVSSGSGSGTRKYTIEDRHGRRKEYLSRDRYDELIRRHAIQKLEDEEAQDRVEAYQSQVRGRQPPELTAENIRKVSTTQKRVSASHVSGHSRKSSHSSSKGAKSDGIKIQSGDTVLHVYGEAKVEMRPGEDGAYFVIGSSSGRDSAYHGSKSSGSRVSRRKDTITEEDGYEEAL